MFPRPISHLHHDHLADLHSAAHWTDRLYHSSWFRAFFWLAIMTAMAILMSPYLVFLLRK